MGERKIVNCDITRLTNGPKHHLFGFHDLVISNSSDTKYLCLEVDVINRPPLPGEQFGVGYVEDGFFRRIGETTALNYPQGARQQWVADTEFFTVNNRVGNVWGTDLYDSSSNQLVDSFMSPTHMLSGDGRYSYGLDYARLFRLGRYGYSGLPDTSEQEPIPASSGITVMDLHSGNSELLVSVKKVAECGIKGAVPVYGHHYITHLCLNPSSTRIAFLHRYPTADGGEMSRLMTISVDGSDIRCLATGFLSHYHWKDDSTLYIFGRINSAVESIRNLPLMNIPIVRSSVEVGKKIIHAFIGKGRSLVASSNSFIIISDKESSTPLPFAKDIIPVDGHPMTCPVDNDICSLDTYPSADGYRDLFLYDFRNNLRMDLGRFKMLNERPDQTLKDEYFEGVDPLIVQSITEESLSFTRSGLHCDLHPRWNYKGTKVAFDSIHEGTRQVYLADVKGLF